MSPHPIAPDKKPKDIISNELYIRKGFVRAGSTSFQLRNIVSLDISGNRKKSAKIAALCSIICFFIFYVTINLNSISTTYAAIAAYAISFAAAVVSFKYWVRHELLIMTNAGTPFRITTKRSFRYIKERSFWLTDRSKEFVTHLKEAIVEAIDGRDNAAEYHINVSEQKVERMNVTNLANASNTNVVVGDATNNNETIVDETDISQTANASSQQASDISELIRIVGQTKNETTDALKLHLKIVREYLEEKEKGRTKTEAKMSWRVIADHIGAIAGAGTRAFELAERISRVLG
jgi:hypothetical protein